VLASKSCPACAELKRKMPALKFLDLDANPEANRLADQLGIAYIPAVILVDSEAGTVCLVDRSLKPLKCAKGKM